MAYNYEEFRRLIGLPVRDAPVEPTVEETAPVKEKTVRKKKEVTADE